MFQIPAQYADGQQHAVYAYGIDTGANAPTMLQGSPKYFTINPPPPATPTWWAVNVISQTQLDVYWNAIPNATGYNLKMDGNQIAANQPWVSFPATGLAPGSNHTFEVQAVNQWGVSAWSSPISGTTLAPILPATPTWGTVNTISQTQLDVYWNAAPNAAGYNVKMDGNQIATNVPALMIPVFNLAPGTTYTFEVQGVNQYGVSAWSSQRSGTTQPAPTPTPTPTPLPPGWVNYAFGMSAQQSTTWSNWGAGLATDGNTDGNFNNNSVTHTQLDNQAWWQVDLGQLRQINSIKLWNRTDCCPERLSNFYVLVSDNPFTSTDLNTTLAQSGVSAYQQTATVNGSSEISISRSGRYLRIQLIGQNYLSLAEVQVFGNSSTPTPTPTPTPPSGTLKLSKEYIYSGSRQLAVEDYGITPPNPTPTP